MQGLIQGKKIVESKLDGLVKKLNGPKEKKNGRYKVQNWSLSHFSTVHFHSFGPHP